MGWRLDRQGLLCGVHRPVRSRFYFMLHVLLDFELRLTLLRCTRELLARTMAAVPRYVVALLSPSEKCPYSASK